MKKTITLLAFQCCIWGALMAQPSYENSQIADVQAYMYNMSATPINGNNDETNQLRTGTVIYYKTSEGRWGKMRIQQYDFNLIIEWITYNDNGSTYFSASNFTVRSSYTYDLDLGKEATASNDFWWQCQTHIIRNIVPNNGAQFYKVIYSKKGKKTVTEPIATNPNTLPAEQPKTKEQRKAENVETGLKIVGGLADAFGKKKEQKAKKEEEQKTQQIEPKSESVIQQQKSKSQGTAQGLRYDDVSLSDIKEERFSSNMAFNLNQPGSGSLLILYRTNEGRYGKFEFLNRDYNKLYIRWTTYNADGSVYSGANINLAIPLKGGCDLDMGSINAEGADFIWDNRGTNYDCYLESRNGSAFSIIARNRSVAGSKLKSKTGETNDNSNSELTKSKKTELDNNVINSTAITWQYPLSNNTTTSTASLELKACVETAETIKEYTLLQNGQRLSISRGLMPRKADDCLNVFNQTVMLKNGENTFQLVAQTAKGEVKSSVFNIIFDKNSRPTEPIATETKIEKRIALVIGNADYTEGSKLKNPVNDANLITQTLKSLGFRVMQFNNLKKTDFERAIRDFSTALADYNVALFYYAGHGVQVDGENYLLPVDAKLQDKRDVRFEAVKVRFAIEEFENHPDNVNIVILDACRNNPFRSWARGGSEGFKPMNIGGTLVAFATAPDATASDGTGSNGLYTEELAKQMLINQPLEAVFRETRRAVLSRSSRTQNPQEWSQLTQSFYFKK